MMQKNIQYKVLSTKNESWLKISFDPKKMEDKLNEMGSQGWDLVNTFDINQHNGNTKEVIFILKKASE